MEFGLQAACRNRQAILARGIEELSEKLSRATAVAQYVTGQLATHKRTRRSRYPASILGCASRTLLFFFSQILPCFLEINECQLTGQPR